MAIARLTVVLELLAATLAGCANKQETAPPQVPKLSVRLSDFDLTPRTATVKGPGEVFILVRNNARTVHALAVEGPSGTEKTDAISPGAGATLRVGLSEPGQYRWYCPLADHAERGMRGTITVERG